MATVVLGSMPILKTTIKAAVNLTKRRFVDFAGNPCAAGEASKGVAMHKTDSGKLATLISLGIAEVEVGAAVAVGDAIVSDANGKGIKAVTLAVTVDSGGTTVTSTSANGAITTVAGSVPPEIILGRALDVGSADGDVVRVLLGVN